MQRNKNTSETDKNRDVFDDDTMRRILKETAEEVKPVNPAIFSRISQSIERQEKTEKSRWSFMDRLRDYFAMPQLAWGFAAMQTVVICLFLVYSPQKQQAYQVLSSSRVETASSGPSFYIMFNDSARITEIEHLLLQTGAKIIDGPGKKGIYTITFQHKQTNSVGTRLKTLQQSSLITFIEQIY
jgi:hypothetical protein